MRNVSVLEIVAAFYYVKSNHEESTVHLHNIVKKLIASKFNTNERKYFSRCILDLQHSLLQGIAVVTRKHYCEDGPGEGIWGQCPQ